MKILYVITALDGGGAEKLLIDICSLLTNEHSVSVVYLKNLTYFKEHFESIGIMPAFIDLEKYGFMKTVFLLRKFIKKGHFDIIHTHLPSADTIGRTAAFFIKNIKIISTIHSTDEWKITNSLSSFFLKLFNRITVNRFENVRLIAVSKTVKAFCVKYEKIKPSKIKVIYNFANFDNVRDKNFKLPFEKREGDFLIACIGRLEEIKGQIYLLKAFNELYNKKNLKNLRLILLGEGSLEETYRQYIKENNLSEAVFMPGYKQNVFDYLEKSDLYVSPSLLEGYGISLMEAFYCRIPALASDIDTNREVIGNLKNGILFESKNYLNLAEKIEDFLNNAYDIKSITENAYNLAVGLDKKRHMERLMRIYTQ